MPIALPILMYHRVTQPEADDRFANLCLPPEAFAAHLDCLAKRGNTTIGMPELIDAVQRGNSPARRPMMITFDDGTEDLYTHALPLLVAAGVRSVVFQVTGLLAGRGEWLTRDDSCAPPPMLSREQIREMSEAGVAFGGHTVTHPHLTKLSRDEKRSEIADSKKMIEDITGREAKLFCYPYGDYDEECVELVQAAGYQGAVTTVRGTRHTPEDLFTLARAPVHADVTLRRLRYRLSWLYGWKYG